MGPKHRKTRRFAYLDEISNLLDDRITSASARLRDVADGCARLQSRFKPLRRENCGPWKRLLQRRARLQSRFKPLRRENCRPWKRLLHLCGALWKPFISFSPCLSRKKPFQVSPRCLRSALGLPRLRKAPKPIKIELFSLGLRRASETG
jgi:hypothetical protein